MRRTLVLRGGERRVHARPSVRARFADAAATGCGRAEGAVLERHSTEYDAAGDGGGDARLSGTLGVIGRVGRSRSSGTSAAVSSASSKSVSRMGEQEADDVEAPAGPGASVRKVGTL